MTFCPGGLLSEGGIFCGLLSGGLLSVHLGARTGQTDGSTNGRARRAMRPTERLHNKLSTVWHFRILLPLKFREVSYCSNYDSVACWWSLNLKIKFVHCSTLIARLHHEHVVHLLCIKQMILCSPICTLRWTRSKRAAAGALGLNRLASARRYRISGKTPAWIGGFPVYTWRWSPTSSDVMNNTIAVQHHHHQQQQQQQIDEASLRLWSKRRDRRCLWPG